MTQRTDGSRTGAGELLATIALSPRRQLRFTRGGEPGATRMCEWFLRGNGEWKRRRGITVREAELATMIAGLPAVRAKLRARASSVRADQPARPRGARAATTKGRRRR